MSEQLTLKTGILAYLDTFSGQIPCRVLAVAGDSEGRICAPSPTVKVKLTATRGAYRRGEIVESTAFHVYPRECRVVRNGHYRIKTNYIVKGDL